MWSKGLKKLHYSQAANKGKQQIQEQSDTPVVDLCNSYAMAN